MPVVKYEKLPIPAVHEALLALDEWALTGDAAGIAKSFTFGSFTEAFGFMTECALKAEKLNHHPEWFNSYTRVDVLLTTHATKSLTDLDFKLARSMDKAYLRRN